LPKDHFREKLAIGDRVIRYAEKGSIAATTVALERARSSCFFWHGEQRSVTSRDYFLTQAETCLRLARSLGGGEVKRRLLAMALEYQAKAHEAEHGQNDAEKDE
jgi:hypothetical protein